MLISSEMEELIDGADRVVVLRDGAVVGELTGDDVTEDARAGRDRAGPGMAAPRMTDLDRSGDRPRRPGTGLLGWLQDYGVYVAVVVLLLFNVVFTDNFLSAANFRTQLIQVAPVCIVALGMALVIGTEGIDLSVGSVMALAAALIPLYLGYGPAGAIVVALARRRCSPARSADRWWPTSGCSRSWPRWRCWSAAGAWRWSSRTGSSRRSATRTLLALGTGDLLGMPIAVLVAAVLAVLVGFAGAAHHLRPPAGGRRRQPAGQPRSPGCRCGGCSSACT